MKGLVIRKGWKANLKTGEIVEIVHLPGVGEVGFAIGEYIT